MFKINANNAVWTEWVKYTEQIRADADEMSKEELLEKLLSYEEIYSEKQKKKYLKKLKKLKSAALTDLWIEKEYHRLHPYGI